MMRKLYFLLCVVFFAAMLSGCGYVAGSLLPSGQKNIYVDNFKNGIDVGEENTEYSKYALYRPGMENDITRAIVDRFTFDGNLKIADRDNADIMLTGTLSDYRKEALRYDNADNVEEYRVKITVDMELIRPRDNKVLWREKSFTGESTYNTTGKFATSEQLARDEAVEDLARRIVERTVEGW